VPRSDGSPLSLLPGELDLLTAVVGPDSARGAKRGNNKREQQRRREDQKREEKRREELLAAQRKQSFFEMKAAAQRNKARALGDRHIEPIARPLSTAEQEVRDLPDSVTPTPRSRPGSRPGSAEVLDPAERIARVKQDKARRKEAEIKEVATTIAMPKEKPPDVCIALSFTI
jgi:hypothetical protein